MALSLSSSRTVPSWLPRITVSKTCLRHATLIPRARRPYSFTQLVRLSDGSTYTVRTTSPLALYRSTKDTCNTPLWQPSDFAMKNIEQDEAGKLAMFRQRFGHGFDLSVSRDARMASTPEDDEGAQDDNLSSLVTEYAKGIETEKPKVAASPKKKGKK
ncbi:hypothetical protein CDD82_4757 [Ophiocordyceps australis]|uniref:Ribosomal protein bL31m N-terminal domain-containing protein n=1 Tax=Ophiocordyceps australis TaxID=1399860 RepID=A0A2C5Z619_9HYPO|nr:hypothetical protein CDD82_4757 [Ophiocordyceps australis]